MTNKENTELYRLALCRTDEQEEISMTTFVLKYAFVNQFYELVKVAFDFRQYILMPGPAIPMDPRLLLDSQFGGSFPLEIQKNDLRRWHLQNAYAVPTEIVNWVKERFPAATQYHSLSPGLQAVEQGSGAGIVRLDFRSEDFTLIAAQGKDVLLAQVFGYTTPGDVLYYLLQCCRRFYLSPDDVRVVISGLLDIDSTLYKDIYQYFIHVEFREAGWGVVGDWPAHFFTFFNELAVCGS